MSEHNFQYYIFTLEPQHVWRLWNGVVVDLTNQTRGVKIKVPSSKKFSSMSELFEDLGTGIKKAPSQG